MSDILYDAAQRIRIQLERFPEAFESLQPEIETLLEHMDQVRRRLDSGELRS